MTRKPTLLERAAEVYDFASGLPMTPADAPMPAPAPRPLRAAPSVEQTSQAAPMHEPRRAASVAVSHRHVAVDPAAMNASGLPSPDGPGGALGEEMRLIKRRLLAAIDGAGTRGDEMARVVLVASGKPGEGKTFVALNLALSIAGETERSVLLIDGDNAKPELLGRLGVDEDGPGFADSLADPRLDPESLVLGTDIPRLALLPAGRKDRNIPEYFASARMPELMGRLVEADRNRIVIIDSSPALAASATGVLAQHAGQCLVVVRADETAEGDLKETLDLLSGCENLSLVLNDAAFQIGGRRFGKYEEYR